MYKRQALNSHRQLGLANDAIGKSLEKLSSGYRINRAGDDAAGLAISEKMRAKIKGLESAMSNSQDAISLVQTAEGAMQEIHSMLNRMAELATKASNSTYDATDRQAIQDELDAMSEEIDRIADSIEFNGTKLMDGSATESVSYTHLDVYKRQILSGQRFHRMVWMSAEELSAERQAPCLRFRKGKMLYSTKTMTN